MLSFLAGIILIGAWIKEESIIKQIFSNEIVGLMNMILKNL